MHYFMVPHWKSDVTPANQQLCKVKWRENPGEGEGAESFRVLTPSVLNCTWIAYFGNALMLWVGGTLSLISLTSEDVLRTFVRCSLLRGGQGVDPFTEAVRD
jgi:hypothetical protein